MSEELVQAPGPTIESKIAIAKQKKATGDQAFKLGNTKDALRSYHESLMFLLGLDKNALQSMGMATKPESGEAAKKGEERTEIDELVEKIYANMSACHLKNENWKRAIEASDKALAKNANNFKALFRKGKAQGELGFFDKAVKTLEDVKTKNPSDTAIVDQEIARLRAIDDERERAHRNKLKGFLKSKAPEESISDKATEEPSTSS